MNAASEVRLAMKHVCLSLCLLFAVAAQAQAAPQPAKTLAATPPMGWNSWDSYGLTITQAQFKANVEWLHEHLQPYGWQYVVIDEGWYLAHPENSSAPGYTLSADGRYQPAPDRFPSANNNEGFKPLADWVHSLGLKFGIHIIRGIPREAVARNLPIAGSSFRARAAADTSDTCSWNSDNYGVKDDAAGQAYYDALMKLYASWGVDFIKVDCISSPYKAAQIHMIDRAIRKTGRPIVLSLSPGPTPLAEAADVERSAQQWRISNDFWDVWSSPHSANSFPQNLKNQFALVAAWEPYAGITNGRGHWPDADMLPIGYLGPHPGWGTPRWSRLTHTEQQTLLTLWSIARSPLFLGANLTRMNAATLALLTNPEVIAVDQHTTGNHVVAEASGNNNVVSMDAADTAPVTSPQFLVYKHGTGNHVASGNNGNIVIWVAHEGPDTILAVFNRGNSLAWVEAPAWNKLGNQFGLSQTSYEVRDLWRRRNLGRMTSLNILLPAHGSVLLRLSK